MALEQLAANKNNGMRFIILPHFGGLNKNSGTGWWQSYSQCNASEAIKQLINVIKKHNNWIVLIQLLDDLHLSKYATEWKRLFLFEGIKVIYHE
jgi:hypothetical protein